MKRGVTMHAFVTVTVSVAQFRAESTEVQFYRALQEGRTKYPNAFLGYTCATYLDVELRSGFVDKINGFVW